MQDIITYAIAKALRHKLTINFENMIVQAKLVKSSFENIYQLNSAIDDCIKRLKDES